MEQLPNADSYLTDIHTNIKDRNQAYAIEADYIKNWRNSRFTTKRVLYRESQPFGI